MIDTTSSATKQACVVFKDTLCNGVNCMGWRTLDGDPDAGFCGMVPVLPYQARELLQAGSCCCGGSGGAEIVGDHGFQAVQS